MKCLGEKSWDISQKLRWRPSPGGESHTVSIVDAPIRRRTRTSSQLNDCDHQWVGKLPICSGNPVQEARHCSRAFFFCSTGRLDHISERRIMCYLRLAVPYGTVPDKCSSTPWCQLLTYLCIDQPLLWSLATRYG